MAELEQFCILAKTQKGRACAALIQQVLSNRKIFFFGELLALPSVSSLCDTEFAKSLKTLELFAFGTWQEYVTNSNNFLELNEAQKAKLKQLTIVSLAEKNKIISYTALLRELEIDSVRVLEDLIIETIYAGIISGKLDQKRGEFRVKSTAGRDVRPDKIDDIIQKLTSWKESCAAMANALDRSSSTVKDQRDAAKIEQDATQKLADDVKAAIKESIANGEPVVGGYGNDMGAVRGQPLRLGGGKRNRPATGGSGGPGWGAARMI